MRSLAHGKAVAGRAEAFYGSARAKAGSIQNTVTERRFEHYSDGDGRKVLEKRGSRSYQVGSPPSGSLATEAYFYQIWSTVLGAPLTTIKPAGTEFGQKKRGQICNSAILPLPALINLYFVTTFPTTSATFLSPCE